MAHSGFAMFRLQNDIALIRLATPAIINENVQPVCLPKDGEEVNEDIQVATIIGWGISNPVGLNNLTVSTVPIRGLQ